MKLIKCSIILSNYESYVKNVVLNIDNNLVRGYNTYTMDNKLFVEYFNPINQRIQTKVFNSEDYVNVK